VDPVFLSRIHGTNIKHHRKSDSNYNSILVAIAILKAQPTIIVAVRSNGFRKGELTEQSECP
jgi:hypothetical protein